MAAGQTVASLQVEIGADIAQAKARLAELRGDLDKTAKDAQSSANKFADSLESAGKRLTSVGQGMTVGLTLPIVAVGGAMMKAASDAVESENLFAVSLGGMADSARDWSEEVSDALKLNAYEVRKQVGVWDVMIKNMGVAEGSAYDMSKQLTVLAADMASFYNMSPEEAFQKLQAGMAGEIEPLRRLGIMLSVANIEAYALSKGITKSYESMSDAEKTMLRYELILQQTTTAQGDLARTMDSPTNKLRALKAQAEETEIAIGTKLLPVMVAGLTAASGALDMVTASWGTMGDAGQTALLVVAGGLAVSGPLLMGLGMMAGAVANIIRLTQLLQTTSVASFGAMGAAASAAAILVGGLVAAYAAAQLAAPAAEKLAYGDDLSGLTLEKANASRAYAGQQPWTQAELDAYIASKNGTPAPRGSGGGGGGAAQNAMAEGGWLNEPVVGYGTRSGQGYLLAEKGPEYVGKGGAGGGSIQVGPNYISTEVDAQRLLGKIEDMLRARLAGAMAQSTRWPVGLSEV